MIKLISFDIGGTLVHYTSKSCKLTKLQNLTSLPKEVLLNAIGKHFQSSKEPLDVMTKNFCAELHLEHLYDEVKEIYSQENEINLDKNTEFIMKELKKRGYTIITLSNVCYWNCNCSLFETFDKLIDKQIYSFDIGKCKPEKSVFEYVQNLYNLNPDEIMHIGNSYRADIKPAKEAGWNTIYYTSENIENEVTTNNLVDVLQLIS